MVARTSCGRESRFDSEPEVVCVSAKALKKQQQYGIRKLQRLIVVHLRIGSGFKGVKVLYMLGCCLVADNILRDGA